MKKALALATALILMLCMSGMQMFADGTSVKVYVTVSDGKLEMTQEAVTVTDADKDGALTINDALYLAHEAKYNGGAAAGYASEKGNYGLAITKLWGITNGGSYGYYVNSKAANGLTDAVKDGDYIDAFVYTDTSSFSDVYCYFDARTAEVADGKLTLTLSSAGFDSNFAPIVKPVEGAVILLDGKETSYKTDAQGKVTVKFSSEGACVISAKSDSSKLVPPVCIATVSAAASDTASSPDTGVNSTAVYCLVGAAVLSAVMFALISRRKAYEK